MSTGGETNCPNATSGKTSAGAQNGAEKYTYYDALGRVIANDTEGFSGAWIRVATQYDAYGRVSETSRPYFTAGSPTIYWTSYTYDVKNRVTLTTFPDTSTTTTSYVYDAFGDLLTTTDPSGNVISNTFDVRGRKTAMSDPDMGGWTYNYDALSELTSQTDAKSQTTSLTYDLLGRLTQSVAPDLTSNWIWGECQKFCVRAASVKVAGSAN